MLGRHTSVGGYGGVSAAYTNMLDRHGSVIGLEGALLLAHRLSIGLAGYGFTRAPAGPDGPNGNRRELGVGYGGLVVRYAFLTKFPVYPSVGILIGGGATVLHDDDEDVFDDHDDDEHDDDDEQVDGFFVAQPEVALHANLTRWMRLGVTVGYRITSRVHRFGLSESDLNGVTAGGNVQFGWL